MPRVIDVNTAALVKYSKKLDLMSKRALPRTVRNTLNTLAFDTKKKTLIEESNKAFINRNKTFFKRFSSVQMASGNKINTMRSKVGMTDSSRGGSPEQAGRNMTQQQVGGKIGGRTLIPIDTARIGRKHERNVRKENRIGNFDYQVRTKYSRNTKVKQMFVQSAIYVVQRFGSGSVIKHTRQDRKTILYRIERGGNDVMTRRFKLKVTPLYTVKSGRSVNIKDPQPFTLRAARRTGKNAEKIFIKNAKRQLKFVS